MEVFLQALVNGILLGGFYSLMGMGQNIIFGVMNIVNFCHGEMLMVGMYITYVLYTYFGVDPYVALPIVAVLMFGLGALIQSTLITPSLKTKSFTNLLFLTVGLGLLLTNGALVIFGSTYYKIITPYSQTYIPLGPVTIALPRLVSFLILIVVAIALFAFLKYSTTGKQIRAVSQNPIGAEVVGINVKKIYILTYGLGVALAGIAGSLLTQFYTIYPTAGASFGFRALIVVVVGGLGSIPGAFFAGIFLGLLEQMSALFISPSYSDMIVFVTFIIILVVRQVMIQEAIRWIPEKQLKPITAIWRSFWLSSSPSSQRSRWSWINLTSSTFSFSPSICPPCPWHGTFWAASPARTRWVWPLTWVWVPMCAVWWSQRRA